MLVSIRPGQSGAETHHSRFQVAVMNISDAVDLASIKAASLLSYVSVMFCGSGYWYSRPFLSAKSDWMEIIRERYFFVPHILNPIRPHGHSSRFYTVTWAVFISLYPWNQISIPVAVDKKKKKKASTQPWCYHHHASLLGSCARNCRIYQTRHLFPSFFSLHSGHTLFLDTLNGAWKVSISSHPPLSVYKFRMHLQLRYEFQDNTHTHQLPFTLSRLVWDTKPKARGEKKVIKRQNETLMFSDTHSCPWWTSYVRFSFVQQHSY